MRPLIQFLIRNYIVFLFFLLEGIAISMFIKNSYYQRAVFVNATNGLTGYLYEVRTSITQYFSLKDINEQLALENAQLRSQQENSFIKTDNKIFIKGDTLYRQQYQYIIAKVINNSTNHTSNYLTLNKGSKHGIKKDMAVISPSGVVGVVNEVSDNFCSVISLLHPKTRISAKLKKNDYVGTVIWEGNSPTMGCLKDVPTHVKIARGDTVITSGYSLVFPEGMMIGTIDYYDIGHGNDFYHINIKLSTDFNNIRYVYVVNNLMKDELENLEKSSQKE
jgi:rod shape-determining protein MreC